MVYLEVLSGITENHFEVEAALKYFQQEFSHQPENCYICHHFEDSSTLQFRRRSLFSALRASAYAARLVAPATDFNDTNCEENINYDIKLTFGENNVILLKEPYFENEFKI